VSTVSVLAGVAGAAAAAGLLELLATCRARARVKPAAPGTRTIGRTMLTRVGRRAALRAPRGLAARLEAAGVPSSVGDMMALKAGGATIALLVGVLAGSAVSGRPVGLLVLAAPTVAFLAPDWWLRSRRRSRTRAMECELADVLDLLRVALEAGLGVRRAMAEVGRRHPGLLADELGRAAARIELGLPHAEAVVGLERRCPVEGIATLGAALRRAERHGAPLGDALAAQAEQARARRARAAAETAARAAPKIQLVVALLLVPSAMLLVAAALIPALAWR
jgi:tight adherence protein C